MVHTLRFSKSYFQRSSSKLTMKNCKIIVRVMLLFKRIFTILLKWNEKKKKSCLVLILWRVLIMNFDNEVLYKIHKNKFNGTINNNEVLYIYKQTNNLGKEKQAYQIKFDLIPKLGNELKWSIKRVSAIMKVQNEDQQTVPFFWWLNLKS